MVDEKFEIEDIKGPEEVIPEEKQKEEPKLENDLAAKKSKKARPWLKTALIVSVTVLTTAVITTVGGYIYIKNFDKDSDSSLNKNEPKTEVKVEPKIEKTYRYVSESTGLNLRAEPNKAGKIVVLMPFGSKLEVLKTENDWLQIILGDKTGWCAKEFTSDKNPLLYKNEKYGFNLEVVPDWAGLKVFEKSASEVVTYYFALPTTDKAWKEEGIDSGYSSVFAITVYSKAQYEETKKGEGDTLVATGQTDKYVFVASQSQAVPKDLSTKYKEYQTVIKTFKSN
jgi:hypothetical protein